MNSTMMEILKLSWTDEQERLKKQLITHDTERWQSEKSLRFIGGMDLSFVKDDSSKACCTLVILAAPSLEVVYEDSCDVELDVPYIPGYLAFREAGPCLQVYRQVCQKRPDLIPDVIVFDGNGIFHPRGFGLASHFGVIADTVTIGVAKNPYLMNSVIRDEDHRKKISQLSKPGDWFPIYHKSGSILAAVLKTSSRAKPVYVSIGHRIGLETAIWTVMKSTGQFRVPEPTRQADIRSRRFLRNKESRESDKKTKTQIRFDFAPV